MKMRKLIAGTMIAGTMSLGAAGVATIGAGSASALPPYNPCATNYYMCNYHPHLNVSGSGSIKTHWYGSWSNWG